MRATSCGDPAVSQVGAVSIPDGWFGGGRLALDVDRIGGVIAIEYLDYHTGELFLGGCPATGCPDPALHAVNRGQTYNPRTVATAPRAVAGHKADHHLSRRPPRRGRDRGHHGRRRPAPDPPADRTGIVMVTCAQSYCDS
jgi:hypothetical protein